MTNQTTTSQIGKDMEKGKDKENLSVALPSTWKSLPHCIINIEEFVLQARQYAHLVINPPELESVEKRIIFVFVINKKLDKIIKSKKDYQDVG